MKDAIVVNPYDVQALSEGMQRALRMPLAERQARYQALMKGLRKQDLTWWRNTFLKVLNEPLA
jgi:trehalose 6-phosphate synthase